MSFVDEMKAISPNRTSKLIAVAVIVAGLLCIWIAPKSKREVRTANGTIIGLERYVFRPGRVRYYSGGPAAVRLVRKVLPDAAIDKVKWLRPEVTVCRSPFANETLLTAQFYSRDASGRVNAFGTRVVVFDEHNQSFDDVNLMTVDGVFEIHAFPRRGKTLRLRLMDGDNPLAEFSIPNPCPGPHPVWKPQPMPVSVTNGAVVVTLDSFVSNASQLRTRCEVQVRESGMETSDWQPAQFEILDATGNHWCPWIEGGAASVTNINGRIKVSFLGALWPEEDAWKLRFKLKAAPANSRSPFEVEFVAKPSQVSNKVSLPQPMKTPGEH